MAAPKWTPPPDPDLEALAAKCWQEWHEDRPTVVAFDTETHGLEYHDPAFCATFAWRRPDGSMAGHYLEFEELNPDQVFASQCLARSILEEAAVIVAHNWKFDAHKVDLLLNFQQWQEVHDTEAMAHLLDEHRLKGLKELAVAVLGFDDLMDVPGNEKNPDYEDDLTLWMLDTSQPKPKKTRPVTRRKPRSVVELGKAKEWAKKRHGLKTIKEVGYHLLPRGTVVPYAILDAVWTLELAETFFPAILEHADLHALYQAEMLLAQTAIYDMEKAGMGVDMVYVERQLSEFRTKLLGHEMGIEQLVGKQVKTGDMPAKEKPLYFNPASRDQVAEFFSERGHVSDSYDADTLKTIDHPLAPALLAYRKDAKLLGYFEGLKAGTVDGVFHPSLRQHGTVSGRTSAGAERGD